MRESAASPRTGRRSGVTLSNEQPTRRCFWRSLMKSILASTLLMVALQSAPGTSTAATDEPLNTATLLAQAQDPAVAGAAADPAAAPPAEAAPAAAGFPPDQLEQLVAPIALYPDALLMQVLMASTYPLEIVEADRWMGENGGLKGEALD